MLLVEDDWQLERDNRVEGFLLVHSTVRTITNSANLKRKYIRDGRNIPINLWRRHVWDESEGG